jgi:pimeloyl-ACP methyl ester carboxylesterase
MTDPTYEWAGVDALTLPHRTMDRLLPVKRGKQPGAVIFLHGVNDPGATYETVEDGLCQGLNERLGRKDLSAGEYGLAYQAVAELAKDHVLDRDQRKVYDNPDANLYARTESSTTHSPFIPFYWGYRASDSEISRDPATGEPITLRGQNQHVKGHRLDYDFAREGGVFPNATNNIPDMYGEGFRGSVLTDALTWSGVAGKGVYIDDGPQRRYFVLAAHRLAMLIRTMRNVPSGRSLDPSRETITIIGHSQGTLVALLAQALLHQQGQRCADCLILVDSPYSVREVAPADGTPLKDIQTPYARVQTLIDIVNAVTAKPFELPELAQLMVNAAAYEGRTGMRWKATHGYRPPKEGEELIRFTERDNRGKVYCYFCPEDTVVGMAGVEGIGTFGVPDAVTERRASVYASTIDDATGQRQTRDLPVMAGALETIGFFQRMWTRLTRPDAAGKNMPLPVGTAPARTAVRVKGQRRWAGDAPLIKHLATDAKHDVGVDVYINGEALQPEHVPLMYGKEVIPGGIEVEGADRAGEVALDRVGVDVALGNRRANFLWVDMELTGDPFIKPDVEAVRKGFNDGKHPDDQTAEVILVPSTVSLLGTTYWLKREETPAEARERLPQDETEFEENNYHSAMLNHTENHRWVTAMDVAIGQAVTLDDPRWRSLLMQLANWRYTDDIMSKIEEHPNYNRLDDEAKKLLEAAALYFQSGFFPSEDIVPLSLPPLVTSQTVGERHERRGSAWSALRVPSRSTGGKVA